MNSLQQISSYGIVCLSPELVPAYKIEDRYSCVKIINGIRIGIQLSSNGETIISLPIELSSYHVYKWL